MPAKPATGAWYALGTIFADQNLEFETWQQIVQTQGGEACPVCGEPLQTGPPSQAGTVSFYCPFAGDHQFHVPGDVTTPQRGVPMGRFG